MSVIDGCLGKYRTPLLEEKRCPVCHTQMEIFSRAGQTVATSICPGCGYTVEVDAVFDTRNGRLPQ